MPDAPEAFDFEACRENLRELVKAFRLSRYESINESTSEQDIQHWVERLLAVLGWDVDEVNEYSRQRYTRGAGIADAVLMRQGTPVCYMECKRIGGIPRLNLLKDQRVYYSEPEEQALRYARRSVDLQPGQRWTILSNFEQVYLFEATTDERLLIFEQPEELIERFDDDTRYLTKAELLGGGLARWARRRHRPEIDEEFRDRLNDWRKGLAQDIFDRNAEGLLQGDNGEADPDLLQTAVQRLLDRLIVLQFATDLEAIEGEPLRELLSRTEGRGSTLVRPLSLRDELNSTFQRFDSFYNTTIFAPGHISEQVEVDDRVLREVVTEIAGQNFRRFRSDILGATYESYLGHQLDVDDSGRVRLVVRPEVRRAGGIYYTPVEVVRHIVEETLRPLLDGATPEEVAELRIVDPACGSGSFLVAAYELLADWYEGHLRDGEGEPAEAIEQPTLETPEALLTSRREDYHRRILESHLYGVDLDPEAAEIAAINLIMAAIRRGMYRGSLRKLPAVLGQNIKVGNSVAPGVQALPGHALYQSLEGSEERLLALVETRRELQDEDDTDLERVLIEKCAEGTAALAGVVNTALKNDGVEPDEFRSFVWTAEFPEVFDPQLPAEERGFSCVIGNPPWIGFTGAGELRPYLSRRFETCTGRFDMYVPFIELGVKLLKLGGRFGMITPSNFFLREYGQILRPWLRDQTTLHSIIDFGDMQLFKGATNYPAISILSRIPAESESSFRYLRRSFDPTLGSAYLQASLDDEHWMFLTKEEEELFARMSSPPSKPLHEIAEAIMEGIITGQNDVFLLDEDQVAKLGLDTEVVRLCPRGQYIKRWRVLPGSQYVVYPYVLNDEGANALLSEDELRSRYPQFFEYLQWKRALPLTEGGLAGRAEEANRPYWALTRAREKRLLDQRKIICPEVAADPQFTVVDGSTYFPNSASGIFLNTSNSDDVFYVAGLLNSKILGQFHRRRSVPKANGYLIFLHAFLKNIPIRFPESADKHLYDRIVRLVRENLDAAGERERIEINFARYIEEYPLNSKKKVEGWIAGVPLRDREILSTRRGKLYSVTTTVDGTWLVVTGRVRFRGEPYQGNEYDLEPLVRMRLPQPRQDFLRFYLPWCDRLRPFPTSVRKTLYQSLAQQLLPSLDDEAVRQITQTYAGAFDRFAELSQTISHGESEIEDAVKRIYSLTDDDLKVLEITDGELMPTIDTRAAADAPSS